MENELTGNSSERNIKVLGIFIYGITLRMQAELKLMKQLITEATEFLDSFVAAFSTFDGEVVARLFTYPYLAVDQHGNQSVFHGSKETARYFQKHLDGYKSGGSDSCSYQIHEVMQIGALGALLTVTWTLKDANGDEISSWGESYCVLRTNGKMSAHTSIDHAA